MSAISHPVAPDRGATPIGGVAVLIYDADCGFCQQVLDLGRRRLPWTPVAIGSRQADLPRYGISDAQAQRAIYLIRPGRPVRRGAGAVAAILREQPNLPWRAVGVLLAMPPVSWLAAGCYRLVARFRHRLPGSTCPVPPHTA